MLLARHARRRGDRRADGRRRGRNVRRLCELREAAAGGAPRACSARAARRSRALLRRLPPRARRDRIVKRSIVEPLARRYATIPNMFDALLRRAYFTPALLAATARAPDVGDFAAALYDECDSPEYLDHLLDIDTRLWLPDDLLAKVDRATMAYSLEARVPYLDHALLRLVRAARRAAQDPRRRAQAPAEATGPTLLAAATSSQREKQGFMMPLSSAGSRGRLAGRDRASSARPTDSRGAACSGPRRSSGCWPSTPAGGRNHAMRLWALLILERWFRAL